MSRKISNRVSLRFNIEDEDQKLALTILASTQRGKSDLISKALKYYYMANGGDLSNMVSGKLVQGIDVSDQKVATDSEESAKILVGNASFVTEDSGTPKPRVKKKGDIKQNAPIVQKNPVIKNELIDQVEHVMSEPDEVITKVEKQKDPEEVNTLLIASILEGLS